MADNASVVFGEAPESDEDTADETVNKEEFLVPDQGDIEIGKEISELFISKGEEQVVYERITNNSQNVIVDNKYASSIKKLQLRNKALHENLITFKRQLLNDANRELNVTNQQLLKSQNELQASLMYAKTSNSNLKNYHTKMNDIISAQYIPRINIKVPSPFV